LIRALNQSKGAVFRLAYKRAQRAIKSGFYLEAIVLAESLIADRLRVIVKSSLQTPVPRPSTGRYASYLVDGKVHQFDDGLWEACKNWNSKRNDHAHTMGQVSDLEQESWRRRLAESKLVAQEGIKLANRCSVEAKKHRF
jgi:hypothetical protein